MLHWFFGINDNRANPKRVGWPMIERKHALRLFGLKRQSSNQNLKRRHRLHTGTYQRILKHPPSHKEQKLDENQAFLWEGGLTFSLLFPPSGTRQAKRRRKQAKGGENEFKRAGKQEKQSKTTWKRSRGLRKRVFFKKKAVLVIRRVNF
jgi:hypothetical protein